jgi:hypothetical protein
VELLDELLWRRVLGNPDDETEAYFSVALNDCRLEMTPDEEARIEEIVKFYEQSMKNVFNHSTE